MPSMLTEPRPARHDIAEDLKCHQALPAVASARAG